MARTVAAALHAYRTLRLSPSLSDKIALEVSDPKRIEATDRAVAAAAHKFDVTPSARFGVLVAGRGRGRRIRARVRRTRADRNGGS